MSMKNVARRLNDGAADAVAPGTNVLVQFADGRQRTFEIVATQRVDAAVGRISAASPVGRAMIGRTAGETVRVNAPRGEYSLKILNVEPQIAPTAGRRANTISSE